MKLYVSYSIPNGLGAMAVNCDYEEIGEKEIAEIAKVVGKKINNDSVIIMNLIKLPII